MDSKTDHLLVSAILMVLISVLFLVVVSFVSMWKLMAFVFAAALCLRIITSPGAWLGQVGAVRLSWQTADRQSSHRSLIIEQGGERRMAIDRENLMQTAKGLRRLDIIATPIAILAAMLMIFVIDVQWALAILLSLGVYVGVLLLRPVSKPQPVELPDPIRPELEALEAAHIASGHIANLIPELQQASMREQVGSVVSQIDRMLAAIEEDATTDERKLAAAPLYHTRLVRPFDEVLAKAIRLKRRGVKLADSQYELVETEVLPRFEKAAEEFYQEYHNQEVLDLAVLNEILMDNLDSIDEQWMNDDHDDASSAD